MIIAVPVLGPSMDEILSDVREIERFADLNKAHRFIAEMRLDSIIQKEGFSEFLSQEDDSSKFLEGLATTTKLPKIARHESVYKGGRYDIPLEDKTMLLMRAIDAGFQYVDIGINDEKGYIEDAGAYVERLLSRSVKRATGNVRTKIIINFTDPEKFPDIEPIYTRMAEMGPDIIKIVVKASQQEDSRRMVEYIQKYDNTRSPKFVGICTHTEGLLTRSHGPFYGNYTTYACLEGKSANSGQLTIPSLLAVAAQNFTSCLGRKR